MNDVLQKFLDLILRRKTVQQLASKIDQLEAEFLAAAERENTRNAKALDAVRKAQAKADTAKAEAERGLRIAARFKSLVD